MPRVRVHQHVNPLAPFYRQASKPLDLSALFPHPDYPLHLDIGCARGRFLLRMAANEPEWNFIGVEIREALVDEANRIAADYELANVHYAFCNAMLWLDRLLEEVPFGVLKMVTIQFPDPWFKKKHAKRRMVNAELVETIARHLAPSGRIFVQTDIEFLAQEMKDLFEADERLNEHECKVNPLPVKTERELAVEDKGVSVYRCMFERK